MMMMKKKKEPKTPKNKLTQPPQSLSEDVACNFLSLTPLSVCQSTLSFYGDNSDSLTGTTIPPDIGALTQLTSLYILDSELSSTIPSEIGLLTQLNFLALDENLLTSTIPSEIGLLTQLTLLSFRFEDLESKIPSEIGLLTKLTELDLYNTLLSGTIPSSLCSHVTKLYVECGQFTCDPGCCRSGANPNPACT